MDRVDIGDRVRAAAMDAGILPHDPLGPVVNELADIPGETELRIAPLLAEVHTLMTEVRTVKAEMKRAADKPLMSDHQVKWSVLPALLAVWTGWQVIVGTLLLVGAGLLGMGLHWWLTPTLDCDSLTYQTRPICYRFNGPPVPEAPAAPPASRR